VLLVKDLGKESVNLSKRIQGERKCAVGKSSPAENGAQSSSAEQI